MAALTRLLVGAYAYSHDGLIIASPQFNTLGIPTLAAYTQASVTPLKFDQVPGFGVEGAIGYMIFSGKGTLTGWVEFYKHGIQVFDSPFSGTYTIQKKDTYGVKNHQVVTIGGTRHAVYTGTITTITTNQVTMDYSFVATDGFRELRFMIKTMSPRVFVGTGTMIRCD